MKVNYLMFSLPYMVTSMQLLGWASHLYHHLRLCHHHHPRLCHHLHQTHKRLIILEISLDTTLRTIIIMIRWVFVGASMPHRCLLPNELPFSNESFQPVVQVPPITIAITITKYLSSPAPYVIQRQSDGGA